MQCANREGDGDALALEFVPNIGANRVIDFVDPGMVAHIELDLVDHSGLGKIDQENSHFWLWQDAVSRGCGAEKRILHAIWAVFILHSNANPHRVDFRWIV